MICCTFGNNFLKYTTTQSLIQSCRTIKGEYKCRKLLSMEVYTSFPVFALLISAVFAWDWTSFWPGVPFCRPTLGLVSVFSWAGLVWLRPGSSGPPCPPVRSRCPSGTPASLPAAVPFAWASFIRSPACASFCTPGNGRACFGGCLLVFLTSYFLSRGGCVLLAVLFLASMTWRIIFCGVLAATLPS